MRNFVIPRTSNDVTPENWDLHFGMHALFMNFVLVHLKRSIKCNLHNVTQCNLWEEDVRFGYECFDVSVYLVTCMCYVTRASIDAQVVLYKFTTKLSADQLALHTSFCIPLHRELSMRLTRSARAAAQHFAKVQHNSVTKEILISITSPFSF